MKNTTRKIGCGRQGAMELRRQPGESWGTCRKAGPQGAQWLKPPEGQTVFSGAQAGSAVCIYVESRKTVLMELCVGQEQRCRCRERACGHNGGMNWEFRTDAHTAPCVKQITDGKQLCSSGSYAQSSVVTRTGGMGWTGVQEGRDLWKHTADSRPATAENNTAL